MKSKAMAKLAGMNKLARGAMDVGPFNRLEAKIKKEADIEWGEIILSVGDEGAEFYGILSEETGDVVFLRSSGNGQTRDFNVNEIMITVFAMLADAKENVYQVVCQLNFGVKALRKLVALARQSSGNVDELKREFGISVRYEHHGRDDSEQ